MIWHSHSAAAAEQRERERERAVGDGGGERGCGMDAADLAGYAKYIICACPARFLGAITPCLM